MPRRLLLCLTLLWMAQSACVVAKDAPFDAKAADVRLVIDISGSMKQNDPGNLRVPAVELLCRLMPADSRAGIWTFGQSVNMLTKLQKVDDRWKQQAVGDSRSINSNGLFTNIGAVLEKASADLGDAKHRKHIILLTDGMVDINKDPAINQREWQRIANDVLPKLKAAGFTVHTIALSDNADTNLLNKLSLATNGAAVTAHTADELMKAFLQVFDTAAPAQQLPMIGNSFTVDNEVNELTALIFRADASAQLQLQAPDKTTFGAATAPQNVNWYRGDNYDLVTFNKPAQGTWTIEGGMAPSSRVTVVSDLDLQVKALPNNLFIGYTGELSAVMQEQGKTFINPEFLRLLTISSSLLHSPNEGEPKQVWNKDLSSDKPPVDGIFRTDLPNLDKPSVYTLTVLADGKTFKREYRQRIAVRARFETEVTQVSDSNYELTIKTFDDDLDRDTIQLVAYLENDKHQATSLDLQLTPIEFWRTDIQPPAPGEYWVKVEAKGKTRAGEPFHYQLAPEKIQHRMSAKVEPPPTPPVAAPAVPEPKPVPPEPVKPPEEPQTPLEIPMWAKALALLAGNVAILVGGFFLYKKFMGKKNGDAILDQFSDEKIAPPPPPSKPKAPPPPPLPMEDYDETEMQIPPVEEDEPPMEDLDPSDEEVDDFDAFGLNEPTPAPAPQAQRPEPVPEPESQSMTADEIDALRAPNSAAPAPKPTPAASPEDDMVKAMLRAQGLDLAEDEMDDAISGLIDQIDNSTKRNQQAGAAPPDFDNFDDFGLDDSK